MAAVPLAPQTLHFLPRAREHTRCVFRNVPLYIDNFAGYGVLILRRGIGCGSEVTLQHRACPGLRDDSLLQPSTNTTTFSCDINTGHPHGFLLVHGKSWSNMCSIFHRLPCTHQIQAQGTWYGLVGQTTQASPHRRQRIAPWETEKVGWRTSPSIDWRLLIYFLV